MTTTGPTTVTLQQAYRLVEDDLRRVEQILAHELTSDRPEVSDLCRHLSRFRGKMLRPALLLMAARATGGVKPIHHALAAVVEMFHLATLIHDDVLDESDMRRQVSTINAGWGNEAAVMLGDWLISHAYHLCSRQGSQWASLEISATAHRVCEGELMQLFREGDLEVGVDDYLRMIRGKTAELTALSARLGAHFNDAGAPAEQACLDYGLALGMAFQITDDVLDLVGDPDEVGKTLGRDLAKGKITLPLIHLLAHSEPGEAERLRGLLGDPTDANVAEVHRALSANGAVASAENAAREQIERAKSALDALPDSEARQALALVADFVLVRNR